MPITNKKKWDSYVLRNKDDTYSKCCVDVARQVMKILDEENDFDPNKIITQAEKDIEEQSITGFMAGTIASMVTHCHSRGEEFKKKWNKSYGEEKREGVINPAIITLKK